MVYMGFNRDRGRYAGVQSQEVKVDMALGLGWGGCRLVALLDLHPAAVCMGERRDECC